MDNAPYHSVKIDKVPTKSWKKIEIQKWLTAKNILWDGDMIKEELMIKVGAVKDDYSKYKIEILAEKYNHEILRLPLYHCELNPIELIWSQVKGHVSRENRTFKLQEVKQLLTEGINRITAEDWKACIQHVIKKECELWEIDGIIDDILEQESLIINLNNSDSSSILSDLMSGVEYLDE